MVETTNQKTIITMPKQLWICDYGCGYTDESETYVKRHEANCPLNPANQDDECEVTADDDAIEVDKVPEDYIAVEQVAIPTECKNCINVNSRHCHTCPTINPQYEPI